jgi:hypothetical protein
MSKEASRLTPNTLMDLRGTLAQLILSELNSGWNR